MKTWLDAALTAIAIIFFVPAALILASWNALPGDTLYSTKTAFEKVALAITIKTPLSTMLSLNFTDRRFSEANRLLAKDGSTLGYTLLVTQATQSKDIIVGKQDVKQAAVLIQNIENYQKSIAEKQTVLATQPSAVVPSSVTGSTVVTAPTIRPIAIPTPLPTPVAIPPASNVPTPVPFIPTPTPVPVVATPIPQPTPAASVGDVINNLDHTNQQLEELKQEIKREVHQSESHDNKNKKSD